MKYLKYFENVDLEKVKPEAGQTWRSKKDGTMFSVLGIKNNNVNIHSFGAANLSRTSVSIDEFIERFELVKNLYDGIILDFNKSLYQEDKSIIGCYFITKDDEKMLNVLNVLETRIETSLGMDNAIPFKIQVKNAKLPKSQIEILKEDEIHKGFFYIKIPYWLYKKNSEDLKIKRIDNDLKRLSLKTGDLYQIVDQLQDPNLEDYFKNAYLDAKTSTRLIKYYRELSLRISKEREERIKSLNL